MRMRIGRLIFGASTALLSLSVWSDTVDASCNLRAARVNCPRANLYGVDLSGRNLAGANFKKANLERAVFRNANLTGANFTGAKLSNAVFVGAILDKVKFGGGSRVELRGIKTMRTSKVNGVDFYDVSGVDFTRSTLTNTFFRGTVAGARFVNVAFKEGVSFDNVFDTATGSVGLMQGADFTGATFTVNTEFKTAIKGVIGLSLSRLFPIARTLNLAEMDLTGVDFRSTNARLALANANLTNADLSGRVFCDGNFFALGTANITGLKAKASTLGNCVFSATSGIPATFEGARFNSTDLSGVKWNGVNFSAAHFRHSTLLNATLHNSNLTNATGIGTVLTGADFTGSSGAPGILSLGIRPGTYICPSGRPSSALTGC